MYDGFERAVGEFADKFEDCELCEAGAATLEADADDCVWLDISGALARVFINIGFHCTYPIFQPPEGLTRERLTGLIPADKGAPKQTARRLK